MEFKNYLPGIDTFFVLERNYYGMYKGRLSGFNVITLSEEQVKLRVKKKKSFVLTEMSPLKISDQGRLYILVKNYVVSRKKRKLQLAGSDATWCYLSYDCSEGRYFIFKE